MAQRAFGLSRSEAMIYVDGGGAAGGRRTTAVFTRCLNEDLQVAVPVSGLPLLRCASAHAPCAGQARRRVSEAMLLFDPRCPVIPVHIWRRGRCRLALAGACVSVSAGPARSEATLVNPREAPSRCQQHPRIRRGEVRAQPGAFLGIPSRTVSPGSVSSMIVGSDVTSVCPRCSTEQGPS